MMNLLAQVSVSPTTVPAAGFALKSPLRSEITDISSLISILMSVLFPFGALLLFIMVVYAGFTFMNARGNAQDVAKAQNIIINALIGFVLLVIAFFIVRIAALIFGFEGGILPK